MKISVACCTYNGAKYLPAQLRSIAEQARPPDELVVCDDVSSDDTVAILDRFAAGAAFPVRVVRNPTNLRSTKNFEKAIGLCDGDVIALADQDDAWYPHKLARIEEELGRHPEAGAVFSDADIIDGQGQRLGYTLWAGVRFPPGRQKAMAAGRSLAMLLRRPAVTGAAMAFRSSLRDLIFPIQAQGYHDEWMALLIASVSTVLPIEEPLMQYRRHENNQVGTHDPGVVAHLKGMPASVGELQRRRASDYQQLRDHLARKRPDLTAALRAIDGKVRHCRARGTMPANRLRRLPLLLNEFLSLRYSRFSGSTAVVLRDFLFQP